MYCIQLGTEKSFQLGADLFVDGTGTGILGQRAGADLRFGREAKEQYGEALAPDQADEKVMGNTLFFRGLDTGRPVPFRRVGRHVACYAYLHTSEQAMEFLRLWEGAPVNPGGQQ